MTDAPAQRLFFALWPDPAVCRALADLARRAGAKGGRPVHPEDLHLTLAFLGQVPQERFDDVIAAAGAVSFAPFELRIDRYGWWSRSRVAWAAPAETPPPLLDLYRSLGEALSERGFPPEPRAYRPHVTLARKLGRGRAGDLERPLIWKVRDFVLVSSRTHGDPPRYRVLKRWPADS